MDKVEYPKYVYHASEQPALVLNQDEHDALSDEWSEEPFDAEAEPVEGDAPPAKKRGRKAKE